MRRPLALVVVGALALAGIALPASAQSATVTIDTLTPKCADGGTVSVFASGQSSSSQVLVRVFNPSGSQVGTETVFADGRWGTSQLSFAVGAPGEYEVRATNFNTPSPGTASAYIQVPCAAPTLEYNPTCFPVGYSGRVTMLGRNFRPFEANHRVEYDRGGSEAQNLVATADSHGVVRGVFIVTPSNRAHPGRISDANGGLIANGTWNVCPPVTTTTSSSTTTPSSTTLTTAPPDDTVPEETTTTRPPVDLPGTPVTVPPTIDLPPPTAGATLTVTPELGPAGFVTGAMGTGFVPGGTVTLTWSPGIGTATAVVAPDGTFTARMLVFPNDRLGPRALVAVGGDKTAFDAFLVVQSSVQPSGQDVSQINRIRRFNSR